MTTNALHVVLGSGQIGSLVAGELLARGDRVRMVRRGPPGPAARGLEQLSGDLEGARFAAEAVRGASVVYDCTSPPYDRWLTDLLPLSRAIMRATADEGAKLVALDNLYMYGAVHGPIRESCPIAPCTRKGEVRARLAEERADANRQGTLRIATGRASDFFGPGVVRQTTYGDRFYTRIFAGKKAECLGDPDAPHALSFAPDVARGLITLADHEEAFGEVWHLPTGEAESMRQVTARLALALDMPIAITRMPRVALRAMGVFSPMIREVAEMAHQWDGPYVVDDSRFRAAFGGTSTPLGEVVRETSIWAKARYGSSARAA